MRLRIRRLLQMKARYPIVFLLLVAITSFVTWLQSAHITKENILKSLNLQADNVTSKLRLLQQAKTLMPDISSSSLVLPPSMKLDDDSIFLPKANPAFSTLSHVSDQEMQEYLQEFYDSNAFKLTERKPKPNTGNFLLPVLYFDVGPNNLFRLFKETIPIALAMKRTVVIPPFHRHPRMENYVRGRKIVREFIQLYDLNKNIIVIGVYLSDNQSGTSNKVIEVPIFDQTYTVSVETNPAKSFDFKTLRYLVPSESMEKFSKSCLQESKTLLICGELDEKRKRGIELFTLVSRIKFNRTVYVDTLSDIAEDRTWKVNLAKANKLVDGCNCAGLAIGRNCLGSKQSWLQQWKNMAPFVRRPFSVKILAKKFITDMIGKQPYLGIHWRYDQIDWNDMCKPSRPESARKRNEQICEMANKLDSEEGALLQLGKKITQYMRKHGFRKAYLAGPPQMNDTIHKIRARTPGLYTIYDVREYAKTRRSSAGFFETNYMMSFLEQEICYLSSTFLASPLSSWSQTVLLDQMAEDRAGFLSVLDVLVDGKPGFPKLTWLFPEGNLR